MRLIGLAQAVAGATTASSSTGNELLEAILQRSEDAIVVISAAGLVTHWNPAAERLLGFTAGEIIGQHSRIILPQAWWIYWDDRLAELQRGTTVTCDSIRRHKDGSGVDVHATTSGVFSHDGEFLGYFAILKDLQTKKNQDTANAFLAAIVRGSPDAIVSTDVDLRVRTWNSAAEGMLGYTFAEVEGKHVSSFMPDMDLDIQNPAVRGKVHRFETELTRRDQGTLHVSIVASPLLNAAKVPTGWSILCSDVTERKRQEEHRRFIMRELSHRAKNLLAVIMAMFRSTADTSPSFTDFEADFALRLKGLAKSHDLLVHGEWVGASLQALIAVQIRPFIGPTSRITIAGPDVHLQPAATQSIGLAVHELSTNAAKYGALSSPMGFVEIFTVLEADGVRLTWRERGGPPVKPPARRGFGSAVIEDMVANTMGAPAALRFERDGICWSVFIPSSLVVGGSAIATPTGA